ncbi:MAG: RiPP maturation radical SAM C-methyltransferase [Deltaproteobacteria bacterium]|nr:RiPP maturation radical SAM C-methyltransferase [Deltaproteobacteria bacterium]
MFRTALISAPWPLFNRPSIQLGTLKAFIGQALPEVRVDTLHFYLNVAATLGYALYGPISERAWLSEACFAALIYPEQRVAIDRFWARQTSKHALLRSVDFRDMAKRLEAVTNRFVDNINWQKYPLAGLSICMGQLTSSLYLIRKIKHRAPSIKVVVGGSACAAEMGRGLLRTFQDIDFLVSGEGELPLIHLIKGMKDRTPMSASKPIPGLYNRLMTSGMDMDAFSQVSDLDSLPAPDFGEYFQRLQSLGPDKTFIPKLPLEISRGCWWRKLSKKGRPSGCAFCNLNVQWHGYRSKSESKIIHEMETLSEKHQVLNISFMDNLLPPKGLKGIFDRIAGQGKDYRLFGEIRATIPRDVLVAMRAAGMKEVQVGIEALSSRLLKKLNKGTTAIENIEIMKHCEASGTPNLTGNLILQFPGSDRRDVEETLSHLEFVLPFRPLKGIPFWLGYGSPVWHDPKAHGIRKVRNHAFYAHLFPPGVLRDLVLNIQGYHGGYRDQQRQWRPVGERIDIWKKGYHQLHKTPQSDPILFYEDGGGFLVIRQRRCGSDDMTQRLKDTSREIYLFCDKNRSIRHILDRFPGFGEEKVLPFLNMMVDKRLMFREGDRYLCLAVPLRGWGR